MYSWIWRKLPGGRVAKLIECLILLGLILVVFYFWFFPWLDTVLYPETPDRLQ